MKMHNFWLLFHFCGKYKSTDPNILSTKWVCRTTAGAFQCPLRVYYFNPRPLRWPFLAFLLGKNLVDSTGT
eukprot:scaffold118_cov185-Amphora_coffeaeformis.AAC.14